MRISELQSYHVDGGWRPFSFLKLSTDEGLSGWSEYSCGAWAPALPEIIDRLGQHVLGRDPRNYALLRAELVARTRFTTGGLVSQAISALENACIDLAAKAAGLTVCQLFGGAIREKVELYWTHCGSFRAQDPDLFERLLGCERLDNLDAVKRLGSEIAARGYRTAKTNPICFRADGPVLLNPGFVIEGLDFAGKLNRPVRRAIAEQIEALRDGAGEAVELMLDVNFAYTPQSVALLELDMREFELRWLEYDLPVPEALANLRLKMNTPLASFEAVYGREGFKPYLDVGAADIAIVDILWNGFSESVRIAQLAHTCGINVAPHNFYGPLADLIALNFSAIVPNLEIMEFEGDDVPWKYQLLTDAPRIQNGLMSLPNGLGWGSEPNEAAVREYAWRAKL